MEGRRNRIAVCTGCLPCADCPAGYEKIEDFKNVGLIIYHRNSSIIERENDRSRINNGDSIIVHNISEETITVEHLLEELRKRDTSCPRCKKTLDLTLRLFQKLPALYKNVTTGICDHCKTREPCCDCQKNIADLTKSYQAEKTKVENQIKKWQDEMRNLAKLYLEAKKGYKSKSEQQIDDIFRDQYEISNLIRDRHERDLEISDLDLKPSRPTIQLNKDPTGKHLEQISKDWEEIDDILPDIRSQSFTYDKTSSKSCPTKKERLVHYEDQIGIKPTQHQPKGIKSTAKLAYETGEVKPILKKAQVVTPTSHKRKENTKIAKQKFDFAYTFPSKKKKLLEQGKSSSELIKETLGAFDKSEDMKRKKVDGRAQDSGAKSADQEDRLAGKKEKGEGGTDEKEGTREIRYTEKGKGLNASDERKRHDKLYIGTGEKKDNGGMKTDEEEGRRGEKYSEKGKGSKASDERKKHDGVTGTGEKKDKGGMKTDEEEGRRVEKYSEKGKGSKASDERKKHDGVTGAGEKKDKGGMKSKDGDAQAKKGELKEEDKDNIKSKDQSKLKREPPQEESKEQASALSHMLNKTKTCKTDNEPKVPSRVKEAPPPTLKEKPKEKDLTKKAEELLPREQQLEQIALKKQKQLEQELLRAVRKSIISNETNFEEIFISHEAKHRLLQGSRCAFCLNSELEFEMPFRQPSALAKHIKGEKIVNGLPFHHYMEYHHGDENIYERKPMLFQTRYDEVGKDYYRMSEVNDMPARKTKSQSKGMKSYSLSDPTYIENGWTMLPTEKVMRKMNVYRMRPAKPEFDWFKRNKHNILYDTGEQFTDMAQEDRCRWFYKNGRVALDYYNAEEMNAQKRFIVYSNGEPDETGRSRPYTILAVFDYLGNGVVFDHGGKIRLKYNQTEGVVLDRNIGPATHWKWHTLNDPPVLQQVMIDTQLSHKDPRLYEMGSGDSRKPDRCDDDMVAIEFDNFVKEKSKKLTQHFKPFQIRMKALKINEHFSLKILDQASIYLIYRDGTTNAKLNLGMLLDSKEIVDTDTAELGDVANTLEKFPARTESLNTMQMKIAQTRHTEHTRTEHEQRVKPVVPCSSVDRMIAAMSRPLRPPLRLVRSSSSTSHTTSIRNNRKLSSNTYYCNC